MTAVSDETGRELEPTYLEAAKRLLIGAIVGSCTCNTKSHELVLHMPHCRYATLTYALENVENALSAAPVNPETTIPGTDDMDKRFAWLEAKAIDMGYVLVPEPEHPDSPHAAPVGELSLDDRQKAVVDWGVTAFGDETGRDWLPLKYEDGPDYCTVTFATGAAFALTVHPERMKLMEAALSASPVAEPWPRATGRAAEDGWTLDPDFLDKAARESETRTGYAVTLESVEDILLDHGQLAPPSAPVAQEPVAWVEFTEAGLIRFWTSDPARAEAERTRRSLTKFTLSELIALVGRPRTPPATPAGVGADEIARVFARWKKSKNLHESLAAQSIEKELLALLSRAGDQSNSTQKDGSR